MNLAYIVFLAQEVTKKIEEFSFNQSMKGKKSKQFSIFISIEIQIQILANVTPFLSVISRTKYF